MNQGIPLRWVGGTCNATVWWSWIAPSNGQFAAVVIMQQPALPLVEVFTGSTATGLTAVVQWDLLASYPVVRNGTNYNVFQAVFNAAAGAEYGIVAGAQYPFEEPFELAISTPPSIASFSPATGTDFPPGSDIMLGINASDSDGNLVSASYSVRFGPPIAEVFNPPWGATWSNAPVGRFSLMARVIDNLGASATAINEITVGRPANDDFTNRIVLTGLPVTTQSLILAAGKEPGESSAIGYYTSKKTVWWSWVAPADARYAIVASATNTVTVGVYAGSNLFGLALQAFSEESHSALINGQFRYCRQAEWNATAGTTYQICIDGGSLNIDEVGLAITLPPQLNFTSPADGSVFPAPAGIAVAAEPHDPDGTIQRLDFYEIHTAPGYGWSAPIATLTNSPWNFLWNTGSIGNYPVGVRAVDNLGAQTDLSNRIWVGVTRPTNDDFAQSITISNLRTNITLEGSNNWSTGETGEPYGRSSVWWSWTAPASGLITIDTCGSFGGAYLKIFTGTSISNLFNFGYAVGTPCTSMTFAVVAGTTYHIAVEGSGGQGYIQLNLSTPQSPPVRLDAFRLPGGIVRFRTPGVPGQSSIFEASTNLIDWRAIATNAYTGVLMEFEDPDADKHDRQFFRVRQQ